jgi:hypothetical protein
MYGELLVRRMRELIVKVATIAAIEERFNGLRTRPL